MEALYVHLTFALFLETAPKAREGPSQETRTSLRDGTAQAQAIGSDQAALVLQPSAAVSGCPRSDPEGPGAETPEVCWPEPEGGRPTGSPGAALAPIPASAECLSLSLTDRHTEGHPA